MSVPGSTTSIVDLVITATAQARYRARRRVARLIIRHLQARAH